MTEKEYRLAHPDELRIYDISVDEYRAITQDDVDRLEDCVQAFGTWREASQALLEVTLEMAQGKRSHGNLANRIRDFRPWEQQP